MSFAGITCDLRKTWHKDRRAHVKIGRAKAKDPSFIRSQPTTDGNHQGLVSYLSKVFCKATAPNLGI